MAKLSVFYVLAKALTQLERHRLFVISVWMPEVERRSARVSAFFHKSLFGLRRL